MPRIVGEGEGGLNFFLFSLKPKALSVERSFKSEERTSEESPRRMKSSMYTVERPPWRWTTSQMALVNREAKSPELRIPKGRQLLRTMRPPGVRWARRRRVRTLTGTLR